MRAVAHQDRCCVQRVSIEHAGDTNPAMDSEDSNRSVHPDWRINERVNAVFQYRPHGTRSSAYGQPTVTHHGVEATEVVEALIS